MRSYLALVAAFGSALTSGATALAQEGGAVFAPAQGGVAVPGVPGGPGLPPRDRGRTAAKGTASIRGRIGGFQKFQVGSSINSLKAAQTALTQASSAIGDTDYAVATSNLNRETVLIQSSIQLLGLANQQSSQILSLLNF